MFKKRAISSLLLAVSFIFTFIGCGLFYLTQNVSQPFSKVDPLFILISLLAFYMMYVGFFNGKKDLNVLIDKVTEVVFDNCVVQMILIFLLSGVFGSITSNIGSSQSLTNFLLNLLPANAILLGVFISSAAIATAMGTSLSTVAIMGPVALSLQNVASPIYLASAVISGAYFGDNVSLISDTTIAAANVTGSDIIKKFKLNFKLSIFPFFMVCVIMLLQGQNSNEVVTMNNFNILLIMPYILVVVLGMCNINVISVLLIGILNATMLALFRGMSLTNLSVFSTQGLLSLAELNTFVILISFLSTMIKIEGGFEIIEYKISQYFDNKSSNRLAVILVFIILLINNLIMANNTIAIILTGALIKKIFDTAKTPTHVAGAITDNFSCGVHGLLPHAPQVLLAASIFNIGIFEVVRHSYYCIFLTTTTFIYFMFKKH